MSHQSHAAVDAFGQRKLGRRTSPERIAGTALNGQTPAGCSLMEWQNDNNGRQRWCVRLV